MSAEVFQTFLAGNLTAATGGPDRRYPDFRRVPAMSAGIYALPTGSEDLQQPHAQDEIYYVLRGRSKFVCEGEVIDAVPGSFIYVAARAGHRFFDIEEDLAIIVLFAPEEHPE